MKEPTLEEALAWFDFIADGSHIDRLHWDVIKSALDRLSAVEAAFEPVRQWYDGDGEGRDEDHTLDKMIGYAVADLERERLAALGAISMLRRHIKQLPADPITRERVRCEAVLAELDKPQ